MVDLKIYPFTHSLYSSPLSFPSLSFLFPSLSLTFLHIPFSLISLPSHDFSLLSPLIFFTSSYYSFSPPYHHPLLPHCPSLPLPHPRLSPFPSLLMLPLLAPPSPSHPSPMMTAPDTPVSWANTPLVHLRGRRVCKFAMLTRSLLFHRVKLGELHHSPPSAFFQPYFLFVYPYALPPFTPYPSSLPILLTTITHTRAVRCVGGGASGDGCVVGLMEGGDGRGRDKGSGW